MFNFSQPNQTSKGIRSYHLESDILFTKNPGKEEKYHYIKDFHSEMGILYKICLTRKN